MRLASLEPDPHSQGWVECGWSAIRFPGSAAQWNSDGQFPPKKGEGSESEGEESSPRPLEQLDCAFVSSTPCTVERTVVPMFSLGLDASWDSGCSAQWEGTEGSVYPQPHTLGPSRGAGVETALCS